MLGCRSAAPSICFLLFFASVVAACGATDPGCADDDAGCAANGGGGAGGGGAGGGGAGGGGAGGGSGGEGGEGGTAGEGGGGGGGGGGVEPVCVQVTDCEPNHEGAIESICTPDGCVAAGPCGQNGELLQGSIQVWANFPQHLPFENAKSGVVRVYHQGKTDGTVLRCDEILATAGRYSDRMNLVRRRVTAVAAGGHRIPSDTLVVPVTGAGESFLSHVEIYGGTLDVHGEPTGGVIGEGCMEGIVVVEGPYVLDEYHLYEVAMGSPR